jgi:hypothetical protein
MPGGGDAEPARSPLSQNQLFFSNSDSNFTSNLPPPQSCYPYSAHDTSNQIGTLAQDWKMGTSLWEVSARFPITQGLREIFAKRASRNKAASAGYVSEKLCGRWPEIFIMIFDNPD